MALDLITARVVVSSIIRKGVSYGDYEQGVEEMEKEQRMLKWKFPEYFQQHPSSYDGMLESYMISKWQFHH